MGSSNNIGSNVSNIYNNRNNNSNRVRETEVSAARPRSATRQLAALAASAAAF